MALNKESLQAALFAVLNDTNINVEDSAQLIAEAIHAYVSEAEVSTTVETTVSTTVAGALGAGTGSGKGSGTGGLK